MKHIGGKLRIQFILLSIISLISGCTKVSDFSMPLIQYQQSTKIPLKVALYLSEELRISKSEITSGGATIIINLGDAFLEQSKRLADVLFSDVIITQVDPNDRMRSQVNAILIPKMISVARTRPVFGFQTQRSTIVFEWTMKDAKSSDVIWVDTFTADGEGPFATGMTAAGQVGGAKIQFEDAFNKLYRESFNKMSSSRVIREFAAAKR